MSVIAENPDVAARPQMLSPGRMDANAELSLELSIVMPCLNEEQPAGCVLEEF